MSYLEKARAGLKRAEPKPASPPVADATEGKLIAVKIASTVLNADIWIVFNEPFEIDDGLAVFYPEELPFLATKDAETLKAIHKAKLANPGARITQ